MGKKEVNNEIVLLRHLVRKSRVRVIHNLTREIKILREKRGDEKKKAKFQRRAERLHSEVEAAKKIQDDEVTKFAINNDKTLLQILNEPSSDATLRVTAKFADFSQLKERIVSFKTNFPDYEKFLGPGRKKMMKQKMKAVEKELKNKNKEKENSEETREEITKNDKKNENEIENSDDDDDNDNSDSVDQDQESDDEDDHDEKEAEYDESEEDETKQDESEDDQEIEKSDSEIDEENNSNEESDTTEEDDDENSENSRKKNLKKVMKKLSKVHSKLESTEKLELSPNNSNSKKKTKSTETVKQRKEKSNSETDNRKKSPQVVKQSKKEKSKAEQEETETKVKKSKTENKKQKAPREIQPVSEEATVKRFSELLKETEETRKPVKKIKTETKFQELGLKKEEDSFFTTAEGDKNYMSVVIPKKQIQTPNDDDDHETKQIGKKFSRSKNESFFSKIRNSEGRSDESRTKSNRQNSNRKFEPKGKNRKDSEFRGNKETKNTGNFDKKFEKKSGTSEEHLHPSWAAKKKQQDALKIGFQGKKIVFGDD